MGPDLRSTRTNSPHDSVIEQRCELMLSSIRVQSGPQVLQARLDRPDRQDATALIGCHSLDRTSRRASESRSREPLCTQARSSVNERTRSIACWWQRATGSPLAQSRRPASFAHLQRIVKADLECNDCSCGGRDLAAARRRIICNYLVCRPHRELRHPQFLAAHSAVAIRQRRSPCHCAANPAAHSATSP